MKAQLYFCPFFLMISIHYGLVFISMMEYVYLNSADSPLQY